MIHQHLVGAIRMKKVQWTREGECASSPCGILASMAAVVAAAALIGRPLGEAPLSR